MRNRPARERIAMACAPALLAIQWIAGPLMPSSPVSPTPPLESLPARLGAWERIGDAPVDPQVAAELGAGVLLSQTWTHRPTGAAANVLIAWYGRQGEGRGQPHSPMVCLPGSGWTPEDKREQPIAPGGRTATLLTAARGAARSEVLYWYQSARWTAAAEWTAKARTLQDLLRTEPSGLVFVRVTAQPSAGKTAELGRALHERFDGLLQAGAGPAQVR